MLHRYGTLVVLLLVSLLSACAPASRIDRAPGTIDELPPIPEREGPLEIELVYPREGALKPDADSTFLFGSVGTGGAELSINGHPVDVAPNGAYLAFIPVPDDGVYTFSARADGRSDLYAYAYAAPPPAEPSVEPFDPPRPAVVVGGRDTLATGSQIVHAYPAPGADRKWFFPSGTELTATGRTGGLIRISLTSKTDAWIDSASVSFAESAAVAIPDAASDDGVASDDAVASDDGNAPDGGIPFAVTIASEGRHTDVTIDADRAPFLVMPDINSLGIVIYGWRGPADEPESSGLVQDATWRGASADSAYLHLELSERLWGFKAFYDERGALVVRLRRPPAVEASDPLRGVRILVDPGHPPGGAIGPTGLTEAEANLDVALRLADMLRSRGADVVMTRRTASGLVSDTQTATELWARVDLAVAEDADLLVSIHNNAFPDGVNPFVSFGTETYYYHPFSAPLAEVLLRHLVEVTGLPNLGAKQRSLALVRPSWMPSTLTESLFMMFPQQEAALRQPEFQERLAQAHLEGILAFLRDVAR